MRFVNPRLMFTPAFLAFAGLAPAQQNGALVRADASPWAYAQAAPQVNNSDGDGAPRPQISRLPFAPGSRTGEILGIYASPLPPAMAAQFRLKPRSAIVVDGVIPGSAAERAGIQQYDIITTIDGRPAVGPRQVENSLARHKDGDQVQVELIREGNRQTVTLAIHRPADSDDGRYRPDKGPDKSNGFGGMAPADKQKLKDMSDRVRSEIENQEKKLEELTARIREEAEMARKQIQELRDELRREAQRQKDQLQRDLRDRDNNNKDDHSEGGADRPRQ